MEQGIVLESVWVAVGFLVFVVLVWRKVGTSLSQMLDERSDKIRAELEEARLLRDEALAELKDYQRLHREASDEAKKIIESAELMAEQIRLSAEKRSVTAIKRREQQAEAKIKAAEAGMIAELRDRAASVAIATATYIIKSELDEKSSLLLVDRANAEIEKLN